MRKFMTIGLMATALVLSGTPLVKENQQNLEARDARIIVKFKANSENRTREQVLNYQNQALSYIRTAVTSNFEVKDRFTNVINALVLEVPASQVNSLRQLSFVDNINYDTVHLYDGGEPLTLYSQEYKRGMSADESVNVSARTMNVPADTNEGEGILIGILDSGFLFNHYDEETKQTYTHETFTDLPTDVKVKIDGVDELKALVDAAGEDFHGKYDATHTTYGSRKVPFYYDYAGAAVTSDEEGSPDYDVFSVCSDHGMHVASMAAGNGAHYKGIAPKAQLALFKVFTEYTSTGATGALDSNILKGLEDAAALGCDVLNMSLGSDLNDFDGDSITAQLLESLEEKGIFCNIAAGNSGKGYYQLTGAYSGWTTEMVETGILSTYSNVETTMTIAACQPDQLFYDSFVYLGEEAIEVSSQVEAHPFSSLIADGQTEATYNWVRVPNNGEEKDYADLDVTGKIAVVTRGETTFADKTKLATEKGAVALILLNNVEGTFGVNWGNYAPTVPVMTLTQDYDTKFATSGSLKVTGSGMYDNKDAKGMASFTSDGATYDMRIKPNISTPGYQVRGAVCATDKDNFLLPTSTDKYEYYSGTSMATPNYAGALALILSEHTNLENGKLVLDKDYIKTVNARTMSTASQREDDKGAAYSPRIQGAGMLDVKATLESPVYLEQEAGSNRAKIELGNNVNIATGEIKLKFSATNETQENKTYTAKISVYRPTIFEQEVEGFTEKAKLQSIKNTLIDTFTQTVTIAPGTHDVELNEYTINSEASAFLDKNFDYACPLEGYVVLYENEEQKLSIPFLGYYGDVSGANPIEPFDFEREPNKVYGSDLVNDFCHLESVNLPNANFASQIAVGYYERSDSLDFNLSSWWVNQVSLIGGVKDNNDEYLKSIVSKKNGNNYDLYVTNNGVANSMIITQFVNRSVSTNYLTITNKATNERILLDHMFDFFWGEDGNWSLGKTHVMNDYISGSNTYVAHRAYTLIPFYDMKAKKEYQDGEYELYFNYTTTDGSVFEKKYTFVIDSKGPEAQTMSVEENNYKIGYKENNLNKVLVFGSAATVSNGVATIKKSSAKNGKLFITASDMSGNETKSIIHSEDANALMISHKSFTSNYDFTYELKEKNGIKEFTVTYMKSKTSETSLSNAVVTIPVPTGFDASKIEVYNYNKSGKRIKSTNVSVKSDTISFTANTGHFVILDSSVAKPEDIDGDVPAPAKSCGGSVAATSIILSATAIMGVILLAVRKRKED